MTLPTFLATGVPPFSGVRGGVDGVELLSSFTALADKLDSPMTSKKPRRPTCSSMRTMTLNENSSKRELLRWSIVTKILSYFIIQNETYRHNKRELESRGNCVYCVHCSDRESWKKRKASVGCHFLLMCSGWCQRGETRKHGVMQEKLQIPSPTIWNPGGHHHRATYLEAQLSPLQKRPVPTDDCDPLKITVIRNGFWLAFEES